MVGESIHLLSWWGGFGAGKNDSLVSPIVNMNSAKGGPFTCLFWILGVILVGESHHFI